MCSSLGQLSKPGQNITVSVVTPLGRRHCAYANYFTMLTGWPFRHARRFSTAVFSSRVRAFWVAHAMCGVTMQFFAHKTGLSGEAGSLESTSTAHPPDARC